MAYLNWEDYSYCIKEIIDKTLFYLNNAKMPFNHYLFKIESCSLLKILAIKSLETSEYIIGAFHVKFTFLIKSQIKKIYIKEKIIVALNETTKDRVIKVQNAAKDAINYWNKAIQIYHQREVAKTSQVFGGKMNLDELIKLKSSNNFYQKNCDNDLVNWKSSNDFYKNNQERQKNESDFEQIFTKDAGWIVETKGKNFIKKKTGTGSFFYL